MAPASERLHTSTMRRKLTLVGNPWGLFLAKELFELLGVEGGLGR